MYFKVGLLNETGDASDADIFTAFWRSFDKPQRLLEAYEADSAKLTAFLISEDAGWITGQTIGVGGGRSSLRTRG